MKRPILTTVTHGAALALGFVLGIYFLPIITAPESPDEAILAAMAQDAAFQAEFDRALDGSDFLHWGEGKISLSASQIVHEGRLAPGPDYKLYLTPEFVEDEAAFIAIKAQSVVVGDVKTFDGLILDVPSDIDITKYTSVVIWCEAFGEFITAARYR